MTDLDFQREVNQLAPLLKSLSFRFTQEYTAAQDLQQDTLLKAYQYRTSFEPGSNFKAWVSTIMRNLFINDYRKKRVRENLAHPVELDVDRQLGNHGEENAGYLALAAADVISHVEALKPAYRIPFLLHYQGYQYQEIADQFDLPIGTVKSQIFIARTQLKERLKERA